MYRGKRFLGIIPARQGSRGLPGKNIMNLCGKPLIGWSIETASRSVYLDECIVSSDGEDILSIAKTFGASVPFVRPIELATDSATSIAVVVHALDFFKNEKGIEFDYIVLLEPTSPLREDGDIDRMIERIIELEDSFDAIVSVGEVREHPSIMKRILENEIEPFCPGLPMTTRRQDNAVAFFPYGVAYITRAEVLRSEQTFYPKRTTWYEIQRYQCYEIDDLYDFLCVESVMRREWKIQ
ncbi:MAG: acylneuraminate cytidylyltransferase family protein [Leptospiraceae bacterium]